MIVFVRQLLANVRIFELPYVKQYFQFPQEKATILNNISKPSYHDISYISKKLKEIGSPHFDKLELNQLKPILK